MLLLITMLLITKVGLANETGMARKNAEERDQHLLEKAQNRARDQIQGNEDNIRDRFTDRFKREKKT